MRTIRHRFLVRMAHPTWLALSVEGFLAPEKNAPNKWGRFNLFPPPLQGEGWGGDGLLNR